MSESVALTHGMQDVWICSQRAKQTVQQRERDCCDEVWRCCCILAWDSCSFMSVFELPAAFDRVDNEWYPLFKKDFQVSYHSCGTFINWFYCYNCREVFILWILCKNISQPSSVKFGVPQGCFLGPILLRTSGLLPLIQHHHSTPQACAVLWLLSTV